MVKKKKPNKLEIEVPQQNKGHVCKTLSTHHTQW